MPRKFFGRSKEEKKKVLIVEDDALLANVLSKRVEEEGFEVKVVSRGDLAFDEVKKFIPKIILLDLILPGIDGFEVLKLLKGDDKTKDIPVVVISNLEEVGDVKSTKALGAEKYFIKANVSMAEIVKFVKETLK